MKQAMIFAAGLGTRLKPITDTKPKALVEVGGKPLLFHIINKLKAVGVSRIVVNVHHFSSQIISYLHENNSFGLDIQVSDESEQLLDTGGGIKKAAPLFCPDAPILIHNVDILSNVDLQLLYSNIGDNDALLLVSRRKTKRYLLFDESMQLVGWTNIETGEVRSPFADLNVKSCRMYAFAGIHVISPRILTLLQSFPDKFGIVDFYIKMCAQCSIKGFLNENLRLMDVGKIDTLAQAEAFLQENI